jgi:hypothetical protein
MLAQIAVSEFAAGMLSERGRILELEGDRARAWNGELTEFALAGVRIDLSDPATFWLALDIVARRTGLDPTAGLLWSLQDDPFGDDLAWVLESVEESRTRPHDTDDPLEALARALTDTEGSGSDKSTRS